MVSSPDLTGVMLNLNQQTSITFPKCTCGTLGVSRQGHFLFLSAVPRLGNLSLLRPVMKVIIQRILIKPLYIKEENLICEAELFKTWYKCD